MRHVVAERAEHLFDWLRYHQDRDTIILIQQEEKDAGDAMMKVWIVARSHYQGSAYVHGLTEENQNIRLLQLGACGALSLVDTFK
jgi:hypothetical protein